MKLLVSDYDQTLSMDDISIKFNIKKINEFRENGNLFMLSTGRTFSSIKSETKKYGISYDFLSCVDGTSLYDDNDTLIALTKMDSEDLKKSNYLKLKYGKSIDFFDINSDNSLLPEERVITIKLLNYKDEIKNIIEYFDKFLINSDYTVLYNSIYLKPKGINKSYTTNYIEKKLRIAKKDIFTIGDHNNDYEMIRDYNGFTMWWGTKKVREYALKKYLTVSQLMNDIKNENNDFVYKLRFK